MLNVALLAQWTLNLYYWLDLRSFTVIKSWLKIGIFKYIFLFKKQYMYKLFLNKF